MVFPAWINLLKELELSVGLKLNYYSSKCGQPLYIDWCHLFVWFFVCFSHLLTEALILVNVTTPSELDWNDQSQLNPLGLTHHNFGSMLLCDRIQIWTETNKVEFTATSRYNPLQLCRLLACRSSNYSIHHASNSFTWTHNIGKISNVKRVLV